MRRSNPCWTGLLALALVAAGGCTSNDIDDGGGPNVYLEVVTQTTPQVTGQLASGTCSVSGAPCFDIGNCADGESCIPAPPGQGCQIAAWNFTIKNVPLTPLSVSSPFNDVVLDTVTIVYNWGTFSSPAFAVPLGITIPADTQASVQFFPVSQDIILGLGAPSGTPLTAILSVLFQGHVVDGDSISVAGGGVLQVQACF